MGYDSNVKIIHENGDKTMTFYPVYNESNIYVTKQNIQNM